MKLYDIYTGISSTNTRLLRCIIKSRERHWRMKSKSEGGEPFELCLDASIWLFILFTRSARAGSFKSINTDSNSPMPSNKQACAQGLRGGRRTVQSIPTPPRARSRRQQAASSEAAANLAELKETPRPPLGAARGCRRSTRSCTSASRRRRSSARSSMSRGRPSPWAISARPR